MIVICQYTGFCYMIAFFVDIFCIGAFRSIPDKTKGLKSMTVWLHHITIINVDDRLIGNPSADDGYVGL